MTVNWRDIIKRRSHFYRDNYRRIMTLFLIEILIMLILLSGIIYLLLTPGLIRYYGSTTSGKIIPMQSVRVQ